MIRLRPEEQTALSKYILSATGIFLDTTKGYLIESRLSGLAQELGCGSFGELYYKLQSDPTDTLRRRVIDEITTGETLFFRDASPFELFRHKLLPEIVDARAQRSGGRAIPIRIWSAACSTGQEVYSLGIAIRETLGDLSRYDVRIVGTDISDQAVAAASRGIYGKVEIERGLPPETLRRWFTPAPNGWKIADEIRAMATFRLLNLFEDFSSLGKFDIVFCRNVAIYFTEPDRASIFTRIGRQLEPDGMLVIGSTESLSGICPQFESRRHLRSVYYQLGSGAGVSRAGAAPVARPSGALGLGAGGRQAPTAAAGSPAVRTAAAAPVTVRLAPASPVTTNTTSPTKAGATAGATDGMTADTTTGPVTARMTEKSPPSAGGTAAAVTPTAGAPATAGLASGRAPVKITLKPAARLTPEEVAARLRGPGVERVKGSLQRAA